MVVLVAKMGAPVRGMERGKLLLLRSRERDSLFRAHYARLSKVVVFCGTFGCTSKGYLERETSLASLERESLFRACYARLSKVMVFCGTFECTSKGYVESELLFGAHYARLSKVMVFCGTSAWHFWVHQ